MAGSKDGIAEAASLPDIRVASTLSSDAVTKAIAERNTSSSRLLRLPFEIREQIYRAMFGDRLIELDRLRCDGDNGDGGKICHNRRALLEQAAETAADSAYSPPEEEEKKAFLGNSGPRCAKPHWYIYIKKVSSLHCIPSDDGGRQTNSNPCYSDGLDLRALQCCRQLYHEAGRVLRSTNTFSINREITFVHFMETQTSSQKQSFNSLRLYMDFLYGENAMWNKILSIPVVRSLAGLRNLELHINYGWEASLYQERKDTLGLDGFLRFNYVECIMRLSTLPLKHVKIDISLNDWWNRAFDDEWSNDDRQEYADHLRRTLLDPERTQI